MNYSSLQWSEFLSIPVYNKYRLWLVNLVLIHSFSTNCFPGSTTWVFYSTFIRYRNYLYPYIEEKLPDSSKIPRKEAIAPKYEPVSCHVLGVNEDISSFNSVEDRRDRINLHVPQPVYKSTKPSYVPTEPNMVDSEGSRYIRSPRSSRAGPRPPTI